VKYFLRKTSPVKKISIWCTSRWLVHTDDPEVATREVEVHSGECADALIAEIENIVGASDRVRVATEDKGEVGELWDLIAGNSVLSVPGAGSSNPAG
jgi:hypothetical protein